MRGLMMDQPLLISGILSHAERNHGAAEVVSRTVEGPLHRYTYADMAKRARQLARALQGLGIGEGDRIGTLAWNGYRHMELYYGVSGMGAVCHMINPRLFAGQIAYIVNHAEDACLFVDLTFVPVLEGIADEISGVRHIVIMTDEDHMPETSLSNVLCYETLLADADDDFDWPDLDENTASSMCYSSGTTGNPKGVLYSHRSTVLHAYCVSLPDAFGLGAADCALPVVPMFHVNAWGVPYAAPLNGTKLVLPGPLIDGESIKNLINEEGVTFTAGVPTVWLLLLQHLAETGETLPTLDRAIVGGSAAPRAMTQEFWEKHQVRLVHAWGMTEMSPIGTVNAAKQGMEDETDEQIFDRQIKQGREVFGVEMKIVDDDNNPLPHDGVAFGTLKVRGFWVCDAYYNLEGDDAHDADGWFSTGDVATIDPEGYMQVTDRSKDVIKSGGEWISSIDLENIAVGHPDIAEAASIGVAHPKWDERPLLVVVPREGASPDRDSVLAYFDGKVAKWWIPDDVVFVDDLPHTATGKLLKMELRQKFKDYKLPTAEDA